MPKADEPPVVLNREHGLTEPGEADLTVGQVAEYLSVAEDTVRVWIRDGSLPARRLIASGRPFVVSRTDLSAYVARRQAVKPTG